MKGTVFPALFGIALLLFSAPHAYANQASMEWRKYPMNPVLVGGPSGSWDANGVTDSCIIKKGDTYKMWYAAWQLKTAIGYATSNDGTNWTKYEGNPVHGKESQNGLI